MMTNETPTANGPRSHGGKGGSPWLIDWQADDNALAPVIVKDSVICIDCSEHRLVDGAIYAVKRDSDVRLWLYQEGFAGMAATASGQNVATLTSLAGQFRCTGPVRPDDIKVVGRVVEAFDQGEDAITLLAAERDRLVQALDECRNALRRHSGKMPEVDFLDGDVIPENLAALSARHAQVSADSTLAKRFAMEQRIDALNARLFYIEERIADREARDSSGAAVKLQVLWDLHYAPFPASHGDLAARMVRSALQALQGPIASEANEAARAGSPAIQLVASPRHR